MRRLIMLATIVALVAMASVASAAYFTAPEWVIAQENGHYVVSMTVYAGANDVSVSTEYLLGLVNSTEDRMRDMGCDVLIPAGGSYNFIYEGNLDDASMDGEVELGVTFCDQTEALSANIAVYAFGFVANEETTMENIKALYR